MNATEKNRFEKGTMDDLPNDVPMMNEAARIRIRAGSTPPWVESDLVTNAWKYVDFLQRLNASGVTLRYPLDHSIR